MKRVPVRRQRGVFAVEFAAGALVLCIAMLGTAEVGRLLWTANAAADATRVGARLAAVCSPDDAATVRERMQARLPALADNNISVEYLNPGSVAGSCNVNNCRLVRVSLQDFRHKLLVPLPALQDAIPIPSFSTTVPREIMTPSCS